jgi:single-stranded DNA-binding protein
MNTLNNNVNLVGEIITEPTTIQIRGMEYYHFTLSVSRASGTQDIIPIICNVGKFRFKLGDRVVVKDGEYRSYNITKAGERNQLMLVVYARNILQTIATVNDSNIISLTGFLCKPPICRTTPKNRTVCDILLATNNRNCPSYIPIIIWGNSALMCKDLNVGSKIEVSGRIQSREYRKVLHEDIYVTKIAYEVSVNKVDILSYEKVGVKVD